MKKDFNGWQWFKRHKWDFVFYGIFGIIILVPNIRMAVVSNIQRLIATAPKELPNNRQKVAQNYNWELLNLKGQRYNLSQSKGKVVVINLWATWCPPCVAEMPSLQKLHNKFKNDVDFYFISNESQELLQKFLDKKNYNFPVFLPMSNYPEDFDGNKLPTTYVLKKNGEIIIEETGAKDWFSKDFQNQLEQYIKE
ncbi:MAG TPA: TlpA disulfide reductase family protein [Edaphocola sp.]|nr:TlpA disulfide reductase family protein [Edaphocola sp.]